jgi:hypothetical protein
MSKSASDVTLHPDHVHAHMNQNRNQFPGAGSQNHITLDVWLGKNFILNYGIPHLGFLLPEAKGKRKSPRCRNQPRMSLYIQTVCTHARTQTEIDFPVLEVRTLSH